MREPSGGFLSMDDLWSLLGYFGLIALGSVSQPKFGLAGLSLLAAGMLAIFWLANVAVRQRNRAPGARVLLWATVAAISGVVLMSTGGGAQ